MIKVEIDGTVFQCDTAKEAAEIAKLMTDKQLSLGLNGSAQPKGDRDLVDFINKINNLEETVVTSDQLADVIDVSVRGLGPKLRGLSKKFAETYDAPIDSILRRDISHSGEAAGWRIHKEVLKKLCFQ